MRKLALCASIVALLTLVGCGGGTKDGETSSGIGVKTAAVWKRPEGIAILTKSEYGPPSVRVCSWDTGETVESLILENYTGGFPPSALSKDRRYAVRKGPSNDLWLYEANRTDGYRHVATLQGREIGYSAGKTEYDRPQFHPKTGRLWFESTSQSESHLVSVDPTKPLEEPHREVPRQGGYNSKWGFDRNGDVFQVTPSHLPQNLTVGGERSFEVSYATGPSGAVSWAKLKFNYSFPKGDAEYEFLAPTAGPNSVLLQLAQSSGRDWDEVIQVDIDPGNHTASYRTVARAAAGFVVFRALFPDGKAVLVATEEAWFRVPFDGSEPQRLMSAPRVRGMGETTVLS